jgi:hypothetical protein
LKETVLQGADVTYFADNPSRIAAASVGKKKLTGWILKQKEDLIIIDRFCLVFVISSHRNDEMEIM